MLLTLQDRDSEWADGVGDHDSGDDDWRTPDASFDDNGDENGGRDVNEGSTDEGDESEDVQVEANNPNSDSPSHENGQDDQHGQNEQHVRHNAVRAIDGIQGDHLVELWGNPHPHRRERAIQAAIAQWQRWHHGEPPVDMITQVKDEPRRIRMGLVQERRQLAVRHAELRAQLGDTNAWGMLPLTFIALLIWLGFSLQFPSFVFPLLLQP